jgi:hypothetical protein
VYDWTVPESQQNQLSGSSSSSSSNSNHQNQIAPPTATLTIQNNIPVTNSHPDNDENNNNADSNIDNNNVRIVSSTTNPIGQTPVSMNSDSNNNNNANTNSNTAIPNLYNLGINSNNTGVFDPHSTNITPNATPVPNTTKPSSPNPQQQVTISINTIPGYKLTHTQQQQLQEITKNMSIYHNEGRNIQTQLFFNQQQQHQLFQLQLSKEKSSQNATQYQQQLSSLQQQQQHLSSQLQQINNQLQKLTHQIQVVGGQGVQVTVNNSAATTNNNIGNIDNNNGSDNRPGSEGKEINNRLGGMNLK